MTKKEKLVEMITKTVKGIILEAQKPKKKKEVNESPLGLQKDDIGKFYVVLNPTRLSTNENIMFETDVFGLAEKLNKEGLTMENIKAFIRKEDGARKLSEKLIRERMSAINDAKSSAEKLKTLKAEVIAKANKLKQTKVETQEAIQKLNEAQKKHPSSGLTKKQRSSDIKKARAGVKLGHGNFDKVAKKAGGGEKGKKIAGSIMWKQLAKKQGK